MERYSLGAWIPGGKNRYWHDAIRWALGHLGGDKLDTDMCTCLKATNPKKQKTINQSSNKPENQSLESGATGMWGPTTPYFQSLFCWFFGTSVYCFCFVGTLGFCFLDYGLQCTDNNPIIQ